MDAASESPKPTVSIPRRIFNLFSGFGMATILLLLLGLLTWLATLEQVEHGLLATIRKYFDSTSFFFSPELKVLQFHGRPIKIPLPGGYWVCTLLFINLLLGGVVRARKGWRHAGNLISHGGILLLIVAGGVSQWQEVRGRMAIKQHDSADVAEDVSEYVVEVSELKEGKPTNIHVIPGKFLEDIHAERIGSWRWFNRKFHGMETDGSRPRKFLLPDLPFDLEVHGWVENGAPVSVLERAPDNGELITDGYYLLEKPPEVKENPNLAGCYALTLNRDGSASQPFILSDASYHSYTFRLGDRAFMVDIHRRYWPMPFKLRLDTFSATFAPNTSTPESYVSKVARVDHEQEVPVTIQMNEPMRYQGLTFYQASYGPEHETDPAKLYTILEIVKNPSDQWPKISIAIVAFGLALQFILKLVTYINARFKA